MTISSTANQQLFAALKAEDGTSPNAMNEAAQAAERRWPLLKSLAPQKWALAPTLSDQEKQKRALLDPIEVVVRKTVASAPNLNTQIANALHRMNPLKRNLIEKELAAVEVQNASPHEPLPVPSPMPPVAPSPVPIVVSQAPPPQVPTSISTPISAKDDSLAAVLQRVERAYEPVTEYKARVPGFLARLGKR
jgi:hypothetical protein